MNWTFFILLMLCLIVPVILVDLWEMGKRARRKGRTRSKKERKQTLSKGSIANVR